MPQISKREQIIEAATKLFHADGFNATGIEGIREAANVSKKTLYNHFVSKEELILTVLHREDENIRNALMRGIDGLDKNPRERLIGLFDLYASWIHGDSFSGCLFIKAASEFSDPENKCKVVSTEAKRLAKQLTKQLVIDIEITDSQALTDQLNILIQGAMVQAHVVDDKSAIFMAKKIAIILIDKAINEGNTK